MSTPFNGRKSFSFTLVNTGSVVVALVVLFVCLGCSGPKVSKEAMQQKTADIKKIAVISVLNDEVSVYRAGAEKGAPAGTYDVNTKIEQVVANYLKANRQREILVRSQDRGRLIELGQRRYFGYPNYNSKLKPYLEELRGKEGIDAVMIVSPFKHIMGRDEPDPMAPGYAGSIEGWGIHYTRNDAIYLAATISLYLTDDPNQTKMYYVRNRYFNKYKLAHIPARKEVFQGGTRFTDYTEAQQREYLAEVDKLIEIQLVKDLPALGL